MKSPLKLALMLVPLSAVLLLLGGAAGLVLLSRTPPAPFLPVSVVDSGPMEVKTARELDASDALRACLAAHWKREGTTLPYGFSHPERWVAGLAGDEASEFTLLDGEKKEICKVTFIVRPNLQCAMVDFIGQGEEKGGIRQVVPIQARPAARR